MKEILAKILKLFKRIICLFKLTISCKIGLDNKEDDSERKQDD